MLLCCIHSVCMWNFTWFILVHIPTVVASIHVQSSFWTYDASLLLVPPCSPYLKIPASEAAAKQSCSNPPAHPPYLFHNDSRLSCGLARRETTPWIVDGGLIWKTCVCCTSKMFKHGVSWVSCKIFPCPVLRDNQIIRCHKIVKSQFCWLHQGWNNQ